MRYKTKVTVLTGEREYRPGTVLPADISSADLAFLKGKGFVEPVDPAPGMWIESDEDEPAEADYELSGFDEQEPDPLKTPEEIRKIRSKKEVFHYAASVGLDLEGDYVGESLKDLQEKVINFQEEKLFEDEERQAEGE